MKALQVMLDLDNAASAVVKRAPAVGTKRKAKDAADDAGERSAIDWQSELAAGTIGKRTIDDLKSYCRTFGLPLSGRKADLVERVTTHLGGDESAAAPARKRGRTAAA